MAWRTASIAICVVMAGAGFASARPPARCKVAHSRTLAQDKVARVYKRGSVVFGCVARTGLRTRLGKSAPGPENSEITPVRLAGAYAAYAVEFHDIDFGTATVIVTRLTNGSQVASAPAVTRGFVESYQAVTSLVVRNDGAVAWIGRVDSIVDKQSAIEVHKLDPGGSSVLLDRSRSIDPKSLRLRGSTLTWIDAGATRSATLP